MQWKLLHPRASMEMLGLIPEFINENDPRPAREQFDTNYAHGGGWHPLAGWEFDPASQMIKFPGDSALPPLVETQFRDETIIVYPYAWVLILQKDGSFEVARMD